MTTKKTYGWQPDLPDHRDFQLKSTLHLSKLPPSINLQANMPPVYDQGQLGSCTANAIAAAFSYCLQLEQLPAFMPSRLFIYYNERLMEGTTRQDAGAQIRDGVKSLNKQGVCPETEWPYIVSKFRQKPLKKCYTDAIQHPLSSYHRVNRTLADIKACLAEGFPIVFGFSVYEYFESDQVAQTGILFMPSGGEKCLGGHAVLCVGYDDATQRFRIRNSWGENWGQQGYFTMPYAYLLDENLSDDFWTLRLVK